MKRRKALHFIVFTLSSPAWAKEIPHQTWNKIRSLRGVHMIPDVPQHTLYVFFDPNCPACAKLWYRNVNGKPFHELPAIWIPLAYVDETSVGRSAAIIRNGKKESIKENFENYSHKNRKGSLPEVSPTKYEMNLLDSAKSAWEPLGGATPLFVFRNRQGAAKRFLGLPPHRDFEALVSTMAFPKLKK